MSDNGWYSTKEAALLLGVSQRTIQNWVDDGKLKSTRTAGGHRRLNREDVKSFLHNQRFQQSNTITDTNHSQGDKGILRVLIVEDDYAVLRLCELSFSQFSVPHQLFLATNAYQGLMMVGKHQPHVIFTDLKMPHIDGLQMIQEIMKMPDMQNVKIVAVTGMEARDIMQMGALPNDLVVLPKPIPFNTVETILYQQANVMHLPLSPEQVNQETAV